MLLHVLRVSMVIITIWTNEMACDVPKKLDYVDHPCIRECLSANTPRVCEYNFTLEHYQTLSRACYKCPHNQTDCDRPHCIPGDGNTRAVKVVNRMLPGPAMQVCKGDTIKVNVYNQLNDFEGTSIHWHGIFQQDTPHMDGVSMVTQCPIPAHSMFQYKFKPNQTGTYFWHAHSGFQRSDGVFGSLIIRDTDPTPVMRLYDHDLPEHTVLVHDWLDQFTSSKFTLHHHGMDDNYPSSILINGKGTVFGHSPSQKSSHDMHSMTPESTTTMSHMDGTHSMSHMDEMSDTTTHAHSSQMGARMPNMNMSDGTHHHGHTSDNMTMGLKNFVPHSLFLVTAGKRFRFRFISNGILNCPLKVSIDQHNLTLIASDGHDIDPIEVESFTIFAGERYDVVVNANQKVGNYWLRVIGLGDCQPMSTSQTAILRYLGAENIAPETPETYEHGDRTGKNANPFTPAANAITVAEMTSSYSTNDIITSQDVKRFYMAMDFNRVENYRFVDPDHYSLATMLTIHKGSHAHHMFALQLNGITFTVPTSPMLTQYQNIPEESFCNETSTTRDCSQEFCECAHRLRVELGAIVELVLVGEARHGMGKHPMHLHGHSFYVLGMETLNKSTSRETVEALDTLGKLKRNFNNPIRKDTVMVPDGGYTIIRFKADNPGFWLFHCHVDFHMSLGMALVLQVGEVKDMVTPPSNFPQCGSWKYTGETTNSYIDRCSPNVANLLATNIYLYHYLLIVWFYDHFYRCR